jgi:hypothetical protein
MEGLKNKGHRERGNCFFNEGLVQRGVDAEEDDVFDSHCGRAQRNESTKRY